MSGNGASEATPERTTKKCFVVSEFGTDEATRRERKQTLKHLVRKVLEPMGYEVQRADDIDDLGQITHQIIERLIDDDLVVADLTGLNPNVFYELAVRHAARKPVITLMSDGETLPFDIKDVRTVFYDLHDPDRLEAAQEELAQKVRAMEANPDDIRNPTTVARNVALLQQSEKPEEQATGAVLEAIADLRDDFRRLRRDAAPAPPLEPMRSPEGFVVTGAAGLRVLDLLRRAEAPLTPAQILRGLEASPGVRVPIGVVSVVLEALNRRGEAEEVSPGRWQAVA